MNNHDSREQPYQPNGTPISSAFNYWDTTANYDKPLRKALQIVDQVHGNGIWKPIRIHFDDQLQENEIAAFSSSVHIGYLSFNPHYQVNLLEIVHEIGHGIERFGFYDHASKSAPEFNNWRTAIRNSQAYQRLKAMTKQTQNTYLSISGQKNYIINQNQIQYLLYWQELFARSYAQYIALSYGDKQMLEQIAMLSDSYFRQVRYPEQWSNNDFEEIASAFENLFLTKGWLK